MRLTHGTQGVLTPVASPNGANLTEVYGREGLCSCLTLERYFRVNSEFFCHSTLISLQFLFLCVNSNCVLLKFFTVMYSILLI